MAGDKTMPVPFQLVTDFKMLVEKFQRDHEQVSNSAPYDENERWLWLNFLGGVYATGWNDGRSVESYLSHWPARGGVEETWNRPAVEGGVRIIVAFRADDDDYVRLPRANYVEVLTLAGFEKAAD